LVLPFKGDLRRDVKAVSIEVSVVVPVMNEEDNVRSLAEEIVTALEGERFEVIFVDDFSRDGTVDILKAAQQDFAPLRCLKHDRNCGQSSAVRSGVLAAQGDLVCVLDGDGQNDPADLPALLAAFRDATASANLGMVGGVRQGRKDTAFKRFASKVANAVRQRLLRDECPDSGCGLKVFSRERYLLLPYFDHMHRFMAALMLRHGYAVSYVPVNHRARMHGQSKYGVFDRLWVSFSDLRGVMWLRKRCQLPGNVDEI
jgi:glycosyltransferase involved in cell wall biosynthesis